MLPEPLHELRSSCELALVADTLGEETGTLAGDFDELRVRGDLVEDGEGALWFGEELAIQIGFELQECVVDAQAIVFHAARDQHHVFLLARKAFADLHELGGRGI